MNKLLIVDDSATMRKIVMRVLRQAGIHAQTILEACNGLEGLKQLTENPDIELVLSDVNMPQMDGVEFVKGVRQSGSQVPIIMITTESGEMRSRAIAEGANGFVGKPFNAETVLRAIDRHV